MKVSMNWKLALVALAGVTLMSCGRNTGWTQAQKDTQIYSCMRTLSNSLAATKSVQICNCWVNTFTGRFSPLEVQMGGSGIRYQIDQDLRQCSYNEGIPGLFEQASILAAPRHLAETKLTSPHARAFPAVQSTLDKVNKANVERQAAEPKKEEKVDDSFESRLDVPHFSKSGARVSMVLELKDKGRLEPKKALLVGNIDPVTKEIKLKSGDVTVSLRCMDDACENFDAEIVWKDETQKPVKIARRSGEIRHLAGSAKPTKQVDFPLETFEKVQSVLSDSAYNKKNRVSMILVGGKPKNFQMTYTTEHDAVRPDGLLKSWRTGGFSGKFGSNVKGSLIFNTSQKLGDAKPVSSNENPVPVQMTAEGVFGDDVFVAGSKPVAWIPETGRRAILRIDFHDNKGKQLPISRDALIELDKALN